MAIKPIRIDFTNVKDAAQFRTKHVEPGEYTGRVKAVEEKNNKDGEPMWVFTITLDDVPSATYPYYIKLDFSGEKSQAWKVRQIATACGMTIPKKALSVNPEKLVGKRLGVEMEEDEYQGRIKGVVGRLIPLSEVAGKNDVVEDDDEPEEDEEDTPPPPRKRATRRKPEPEPEDDEEEDEEEEDVPPPPKKRPAKKAAARRKAPEPEPEDDEEEEDDELDVDLDEL